MPATTSISRPRAYQWQLFLSNVYGHALTFTRSHHSGEEISRAHFSNAQSVSTNFFTGNVMIPTAIGSAGRNLKYTGPNEASITSAPGATPTLNTSWTSISTGTYKSIIRNGLTGAKVLNLPLVSQGATPIDLIRRAPASENTTNSQVYDQRMYSQASLRILLSDRAADISTLPEIDTTVAAVVARWAAGCARGITVDATHPPLARAVGPFSTTPTFASSSSMSGSAPNIQITVSAIPNELKLKSPAALMVDGQGPITCTGKTSTQFIGCTGFATLGVIPSNRAVTGTFTTVSIRKGFRTTTSGSLSIHVVGDAGRGQRPPRPGVHEAVLLANSTDTNPTPQNSVLVSCTGYSGTTLLTGCSWSGNSAPGNNYTISTNSVVTQGAAQIGGFIKIEKQDEDGVWTDVTLEILNLGIADKNQEAMCGDPVHRVLRLQRIALRRRKREYQNTIHTTTGQTSCMTRAKATTATWRPPVRDQACGWVA